MDDEDDTRASDSQSMATSGSHHRSSSHGSNDVHDLDLDLIHQRSEQQGLRLGQLHQTSKQFSSQEVVHSLAEKLWEARDGREVRDRRIGNMERSVRRDQLREYIYKRILKRSRAQPTDFIYKRIL